MIETGKTTRRVFDLLGIGGAGTVLYLGIPALALHLAWVGGATPWVFLMTTLLAATAFSAWRDLERGHVGKLSGAITGTSLVALGWMVLPAL